MVFKKKIDVISQRSDIDSLIFHESAHTFTVVTKENKKEKYHYRKFSELDEPDMVLRRDYCTLHSFKELKKSDMIITVDDEYCECGIPKPHVHCRECGKVLKTD